MLTPFPWQAGMHSIPPLTSPLHPQLPQVYELSLKLKNHNSKQSEKRSATQTWHPTTTYMCMNAHIYISLTIPRFLFAMKTLAPLCFAPYARALAAPPAPINTKYLSNSGDLFPLLCCPVPSILIIHSFTKNTKTVLQSTSHI